MHQQPPHAPRSPNKSLQVTPAAWRERMDFYPGNGFYSDAHREFSRSVSSHSFESSRVEYGQMPPAFNLISTPLRLGFKMDAPSGRNEQKPRTCAKDTSSEFPLSKPATLDHASE